MDTKGLYFKYFVLGPTKDNLHGEASREAMKVYAKHIEKDDPELALELQHWVIACHYDITTRQIKAGDF